MGKTTSLDVSRPPLPPGKRARTEEEKEFRRLQKKLRNRKTARISREKQKVYVAEMENHIDRLCKDLISTCQELLLLQVSLSDLGIDTGYKAKDLSYIADFQESQKQRKNIRTKKDALSNAESVEENIDYCASDKSSPSLMASTDQEVEEYMSGSQTQMLIGYSSEKGITTSCYDYQPAIYGISFSHKLDSISYPQTLGQ